MQTSTYFSLLAEFGAGEIELEKVAQKYFGLTGGEAKKRALNRRLPVLAYRLSGQKSPWLISAADLAKLIDERRKVEAAEWAKLNATSAAAPQLA